LQLGLERRERADRTHIGGCFREHEVTRFAEDLGHEFERLLGAVRHDELVGFGFDPLHRHEVDESLAESDMTARRSVAERST
jgi:hypothetical protein